MSLANVKSNGKYGIFDGGCQGLITAAMLDRIQGMGTVWNLFLKGTPQKYSKYPSRFSIEVTIWVFHRQAIHSMNFTPEQLKPLKNCSLFKLKEALAKEDSTEEVPAKMQKLDEEAAPPLELGSLDGLVVACRRPSNIAKELVRLLAPSGSFVIFCPYSEVQYLNDALTSRKSLKYLYFP